MDTHATPIELIDAFGIGVYLLLGIFHFDLWWHRRERRSHLWLATASMGALAVDATGMLLRYRPDEGAAFFVALNLTGVAVATASLVELVQSLVAGRTPRAIRFSQIALLVIPTVAVITNSEALGLMVLAGAGIMLAYASTVALHAGREGDPEARVVAAGLVVLIACLVTDVLMEFRLVPKLSGLPILGFTILFLPPPGRSTRASSGSTASSSSSGSSSKPASRNGLATSPSSPPASRSRREPTSSPASRTAAAFSRPSSGRSSAPDAQAPRRRSSSPTSTTSRRSTTDLGTPAATPSSAPSPESFATPHDRQTSSHAGEAKSSSSSFPTPTLKGRGSSPRESGPRSPPVPWRTMRRRSR